MLLTLCGGVKPRLKIKLKIVLKKYNVQCYVEDHTYRVQIK